MPLRTPLLALALAAGPCLMPAAERFELAFSTYFGGSNWEHGREVTVDAQGNIYVVGGTASTDFPTTAGAFQRTQDKSGTQVGGGGYCDACVSKFSPNGTLIWSTYLGGPNYDRAYGVRVDASGHVYVTGRAGPGFPVTAGALQTTFQGSNAGTYGWQNGFVAKLKPDGSGLVWSTYVGVNQLCRNLTIDAAGNVYLPLNYQGNGALPPSAWFTNAYRKTPAGRIDVGALKLRSDGAAVLWATWIGGSGDEVNNAGIALDPAGNVFLNFTTKSLDLPTTPGCDATHNGGGNDAFLAKLSPGGDQLLFGTYFGGSGMEEGNAIHNLAIDAQGNAYLSSHTTSTDLPVSAGAFQSTHRGGTGDIVIARFSPTGALTACTYVGGSAGDGSEDMGIDPAGNVCLVGSTSSTDFPLAGIPWQSSKAASNDVYLLKLAPDLRQVLYASFIGGPGYDYGRNSCLDAQGNWYLTGSCNAAGWPVRNAIQPSFAGGVGTDAMGGSYAGDLILAKFTPNRAPQLATVTANPTTITLPTASVALQASASDPDGNALSYTWSVASGPAAVGFSTQTASTTASFTSAGSYVLRVTVGDGALQVSGTVTVTVAAAANQPPQVTLNAIPGSITLPTSSLTVQANASDADGDVLTYAWSLQSGPAPVAFTNAQSASTGVSFTQSGSYILKLVVSDGKGQTSATVTVSVLPAPAGGPFAHWKLDETSGTTAADASGNGNTGTLLNGPVWTSGAVAGALRFDGSNDHVRVANAPGFAVNQALSIALWVKRADLVARNMRLVNKPIGGRFYTPTYSLQFDANGTIGGHFYSRTGKWIGIGNGAISDTGWHHVVWMIDPTTNSGALYLDGVLANQGSLQGELPVNGSDPVYLGTGISGREHFAGSLDDVRIYPRVLSLTEIEALSTMLPGGSG